MRILSISVMLTATSVVLASSVSRDGTCGGKRGLTCAGSGMGKCCSQWGYCGKTDAYCGYGCQSQFGKCKSDTPTASPLKVSKDGRCGNGVTCLGSEDGDCCSQWGYCGKSKDYCGVGCQSAFGTCSGNSPTSQKSSIKPSTSTSTTKPSTPSTSKSSTAAQPSSTLKVSIDGTCGPKRGLTCVGSRNGNCCSPYGFCGNSHAYCGRGCQEKFGTCWGLSSSSSKVASSTLSSVSQSLVVSPTSSSVSSTDPIFSVEPTSSAEPTSSEASPTSSSSSVSQSLVVSPTSSSVSSTDPTFSVEPTSSAEPTSSEASPTSSSESEPTSISTESSSTIASPTPSSPARNCMRLEACQAFDGNFFPGSCTGNGQCQDGYVAQCSKAPAAGAGSLLSQLGARVQGGAGCRTACEENSQCVGFVFTTTSPVGQLCDLYSRIDAVSTSFVSTYIKVCGLDPSGSPSPLLGRNVV